MPGEENLVTVGPPYAMFYAGVPVRNFRVHKDVAVSLITALTQIQNKYGNDKIATLRLDDFSGTYNYRKMRNGDILMPTLLGYCNRYKRT